MFSSQLNTFCHNHETNNSIINYDTFPLFPTKRKCNAKISSHPDLVHHNNSQRQSARAMGWIAVWILFTIFPLNEFRMSVNIRCWTLVILNCNWEKLPSGFFFFLFTFVFAFVMVFLFVIIFYSSLSIASEKVFFSSFLSIAAIRPLVSSWTVRKTK